MPRGGSAKLADIQLSTDGGFALGGVKKRENRGSMLDKNSIGTPV